MFWPSSSTDVGHGGVSRWRSRGSREALESGDAPGALVTSFTVKASSDSVEWEEDGVLEITR